MLALMISASAAIAGMWMVLTSDMRMRASRYLGRAGDSTRDAFTGLEVSRVELGKDPAWTGVTCAVGASGAGSCTVTSTVIGVFRASVASTGTIGDATQKVVAELRAPADPSLDFNVVSGSTIAFKDVALGGRMRANGNVTSTGDAEFNGTIETLTGCTVTSQIASAQVAYVSTRLDPPSISINNLAARCTTMVGVPWSAGNNAFLIEKLRIGPDANPYGGLNASGAYVFDATSKNVLLRDVYVKGMLVIKNAVTVTITDGYHHERSDASLPTLIVQGDLDLHLSGTIDEPAMLTDMNGDGDLLDIHASLVKGIVYATGKLTLPYAGTMYGSAMGGSVVIQGSAQVLDEASLATTPVREFIKPGAFTIVPGTIGDA